MMAAPDTYAELLGAIRTDTWAHQANCIGKWATLEGPDENAAKRLCLGDPTTNRPRCPVINQCHTWIIPLHTKQDPGGVIAGRTEAERNDFRKGRTQPRYRPITTKPCTTCRRAKRFTEFYRNRSRHDGLSAQCKDCCRESRRRQDARKAVAA